MEAVKEGAEFVDLASLQSAERAKIALTRRRRGCQKRICDKNIKKRYDTNNLERLKKSRRNLVKQERSICKLCAKSYKNKHILDLFTKDQRHFHANHVINVLPNQVASDITFEMPTLLT